MQELIKELAEVLGVSPALLDGSALTLALLALIYMVRALLQTQRTDEKQVSFEGQLVKMAADSIEESRKQREAYESNTLAIKESSMVSQELVKVVKDLNKTLPERITAHEQVAVKLFMEKADEMHLVTVRRDAEMADDRTLRDVNHRAVVEKLDEQRAIILALVKELTDDTDETTLRSELNTLIKKFDEILASIAPSEENTEPEA
jgi:hypothetical protein